jgi:hypothetical protein
VRREQYFDASFEYKRYREVFAGNRGLDLGYPGSRRYRGPADLVACGLIEPITWGTRLAGLLRMLRTSCPPTSARAAPAAPAPRSGR